MRRLLYVLAPLVIIAVAATLRITDPPIVESLRLVTFDEYQRLSPRVYEEAGIRILDIDDQSLEKLGQWPWPRVQVAAMLKRLGELGVAVVAFDAVFPEPDRTSPSTILPKWAETTQNPALLDLIKRLPDHDERLAEVIAQVPTVLGTIMTYDPLIRAPTTKWGITFGGDDPTAFLPAFTGSVTNLPILEAPAAGIGSFSIEVERNAIIHRVPLLYRLSMGLGGTREIFPSLVAESLRVAQGASTYNIKTSGASGEQAFGEHTGLNNVRVGRIIVPTTAKGEVWLHDTGPIKERMIPAWEIFDKDFDPKRVEGTIVFVGTSAAGLKDLRATPLNPAAAGVEVHAQIAEQIVLEHYLERPDWITGAELLWLFFFGGILLLLLARWGAAWCALLATFGIFAAFGVSWYAFKELNWLIDPVYPSAVALLLYLSQSLLVYLDTEGERRRVRTAFSRYMSPDLVARLADDPTQLKLGGEIRDMTVMFCDIRGFTSISETLDAAGVIRFINRFLTPMTDIIMKRGGTIDKYMGDAIMAFWNAPLDDPNHAENAARATLSMISDLARLNADWRAEAKAENRPFHQVRIGVGLNTGPICVGNVGSDLRFDYSVIGDDVNLASRLESQCKTYGTSIIIGSNTRSRLNGFAAIELDLLRVKGRERPERIYTLLGDEATGKESWFKQLDEMQTALLAAYRTQDWDRADELIAAARKLANGQLDPVYDLYVARIAEYRFQPPPNDWDGVTRATEK